MMSYNFAEEFSKFPGPRTEDIGPNSGKKFREEVLQNWFDNNIEVEIDVSGTVMSFGPSFMSEAFGKMAKECLPFSTTLIWLDLPWEDCKQNLLSRGPQFETILPPSERETALKKLIEWAGEHYSRSDANSWEFFNMLYTSFPNRKICLHHREEINGFLDRIHKDSSQ